MQEAPTINFKPSVKQFTAWEALTDDKIDFIGYGGSAFSGKSYLLCNWLTIMAIAYPGTGWGLARKELSTLKKTTLITLFKVFNEYGVKPTVHYNYNQQLNVITFTNTSQIFLIDTAYKPSDPLFTGLGGYELTGCAIDESAETSYSAIDILSSRIGRRLNEKYNLRAKMLETFNPAKNHVYTRYYKPWANDTLKERTVFIKALPADNPSPEVGPYVSRMLENADKVTIERLIHGNFEYDDDPTVLMHFDKITNIFTNTFVKSGDKYISADIARFGSDTTMIVVWDGLRAEKIVQLVKKDTVWVSREIEDLREKYSVPLSNVIVDQDGLGGGVMDQVKCIGFVNNSSPLNGENFNNLKSQCYYKLSDLVNKDLVFANIPESEIKTKLIEELGQVKQWKMDKDTTKQVMPKDKVKELIGRSPDISDAFMMRMYFEVMPVSSRSRNPV